MLYFTLSSMNFNLPFDDSISSSNARMFSCISRMSFVELLFLRRSLYFSKYVNLFSSLIETSYIF